MLILAVVIDIKSYRIPNWLILAGWIMGISKAYLEQGLEGSVVSALRGFLPIVLLFPLFLMKGLGAGDIKLLSVVGTFLQHREFMMCFLVSFLLGGLLAAAKMIYCRNLLERAAHFREYVEKIKEKKKVLPYWKTVPDKRGVMHFSIPICMSVLLHLGGIY